MTFDDDDLKQIKDEIANRERGITDVAEYVFDMKALLARLEAAEECAAYLVAMEPGDVKGNEAWKIIKAWRKAAGK